MVLCDIAGIRDAAALLQSCMVHGLIACQQLMLTLIDAEV